MGLLYLEIFSKEFMCWIIYNKNSLLNHVVLSMKQINQEETVPALKKYYLEIRFPMFTEFQYTV